MNRRAAKGVLLFFGGVCYGCEILTICFALCGMEHLEITNTLDLMHCKKFFAKNVLKIICGFKEKDNVYVWCDTQQQGICPHLWLTNHPEIPNAIIKLATPYVLTSDEFDTFCTRLESLKVPLGYCSELGNAIWRRKFGALKTHDYHILMQHLLPNVMRGLIENNT